MRALTAYRIRNSGGFTLLEALLSVALLGLMVVGISTLYASGLRALDEQADRMLLDSRLRSRMELLVAAPFGELGGGSEEITLRERAYTILWTVEPTDLDGDSVPEQNARQIDVFVSGLPDRSLTTLRVDPGERVGKI